MANAVRLSSVAELAPSVTVDMPTEAAWLPQIIPLRETMPLNQVLGMKWIFATLRAPHRTSFTVSPV
jgi:hypothetical protein